jgi:CP family cyanate transporter-like MFS transporter
VADPQHPKVRSGPAAPVWREPVAWAVSAVLAMQSVLYYAVTAWLPTLLGDELGLGLGAAAAAATVFQVLGIPGALVVAPLLGRWRGQGGLAVVVAACWAVVPAGLLLWPAAWPVWVVVGGLVQGAGISLAFALVVLRSADDSVVPRMSSMSQLVGYSVGAVSPLVVGALYAATGGWAVPLGVLLAASAALGVSGVVAGRPGVVGGSSVRRTSRIGDP